MDSMIQKLVDELKPLVVSRAPCDALIEVVKKYIVNDMSVDDIEDATNILMDKLDFADPETKKYLDAEFNSFVSAVFHECTDHWRLFSKTSVHWTPLPPSGRRNRQGS